MGTHREKLTKNGSRCFLCFYSEDVKTLIKMPACGHSEHLPQTPHPKSGSSNNRNTLFYTSGDQKSGLKLSVCPAFLQTPGAVLPSFLFQLPVAPALPGLVAPPPPFCPCLCGAQISLCLCLIRTSPLGGTPSPGGLISRYFNE